MLIYSKAEANLVLDQIRNRLSLLSKAFQALKEERELDAVEQDEERQVQSLMEMIQEGDQVGAMADLELQLIVEDTNRLWAEHFEGERDE